MNAELQRRIQRYGWDRASAQYEPGWSRQLEPGQARLLTMMRLRPGEQVADIACGTGLMTLRAARAVAPGGTVAGADISAEMLAVAARRATAAGLDAHFFRCDAGSLDLPDCSFDAALNAFGLMYVADSAQALVEMHRILRPGGRAGIAVWGERAACGWAEIFPIVDARVRSEVCPLFFRLGTRDTLAREMKSAGFARISIERMRVRLCYASEEEALAAAFAGGPVALAHARFDAAIRAEAYAAYLASIAPYRIREGYAIPGEFVVAMGHRVG